ncbi:MAG: RNA polymerase sigma factor [Planctomycetota bacterium]|jgi:RNA polymerase sigma-70 factor (ECF subfamily)
MAQMESDHCVDEQLVKRFKQGDESAFDRIVKEYSRPVAALANRLLGWPGEVEDIVQDIFLAAYLGLGRFRGQCSLKTWLFTITINRCRKYRYKRMLRLKTFSKVATQASGSPVQAPEKTSMDSEVFERVRRAVRALPAKYREPVVLRYLQEFEVEQISEILGISQNAVQVRLTRAKERLKEDLAELMEQ